MGGFYRIKYQGTGGKGDGAIALANNKVAGLDVGDGIYRGTYAEEGGRFKGTAVLSFASGGDLVTGMRVPPGTEIPIPFDIPAGSSSDSHTVSVNVAGHKVEVTLTRIADL